MSAPLLSLPAAPSFSTPEAPSAAYIVAEICEKIGLLPGVLNVLTADRAVSELLVRHAGVDKRTAHSRSSLSIGMLP
jgi:acyl-CoA reductase-like NAD-dependent aldehyde dehydrogenase